MHRVFRMAQFCFCSAKVASLLGVILLWMSNGKAQRKIQVDASHETGLHSSTSLMTVGAGRANEGLRADWQEQLALVQKEIGFRYLRFHGLLHDDMGVYMEDSSGAPIYNFQYVDRLYDAMLALHIRPFVELSFMPTALASGTKTVFWWKGNVTPPKDMNKWNGLIQALMLHWKERYGEDEITKWYYEVWNEADLADFWSGSEQDYFQLYRNTAETIKKQCPWCRVGGPASAHEELEQHWEAYVAEGRVPADFVSTHVYGVKQGSFDADGHAGTVLDVSPDSIVGRVRKSRDWIDRSATPQRELHYTEWSTSYTPRDPIHDQYISAPFILEKLHETSPLAQSMSYWTFTDIFEENGPRATPFHGGFGLLNYQGIRKPAFFAYKFLAQLGEHDVQVDDQHTWATKSKDGSMQVLFWDYTPMAPPGDETDQVFYKREQPAKSLGTTNLVVKGLPNGRFHVKEYRIGYKQNDVYTAYLAMKAPSQLSREQVAALRAVANGAPTNAYEARVQDHSYRKTFAVHENDVVLVTLTRE